jgi:hypothetical protein
MERGNDMGGLADEQAAAIARDMGKLFDAERLTTADRDKVRHCCQIMAGHFYAAAGIVKNRYGTSAADAERISLIALKATVIQVEKLRDLDGL